MTRHSSFKKQSLTYRCWAFFSSTLSISCIFMHTTVLIWKIIFLVNSFVLIITVVSVIFSKHCRAFQKFLAPFSLLIAFLYPFYGTKLQIAYETVRFSAMYSLFQTAAEQAILQCPENTSTVIVLKFPYSLTSRSNEVYVSRRSGEAIAVFHSDLGGDMSYAKFFLKEPKNYPITIIDGTHKYENKNPLPQNELCLCCYKWWDFGTDWIYAYGGSPHPW